MYFTYLCMLVQRDQLIYSHISLSTYISGSVCVKRKFTYLVSKVDDTPAGQNSPEIQSQILWCLVCCCLFGFFFPTNAIWSLA